MPSTHPNFQPSSAWLVAFVQAHPGASAKTASQRMCNVGYGLVPALISTPADLTKSLPTMCLLPGAISWYPSGVEALLTRDAQGWLYSGKCDHSAMCMPKDCEERHLFDNPMITLSDFQFHIFPLRYGQF